MKLCECGCGKPAPIAKRNRPSKGMVKGEPYRFIHGHNGVKHGLARRTIDQREYKVEWARRKRNRLRAAMTPEERTAKEERTRRSRFGGKPAWNKGKKTGQVPWNAGKTKDNDERVRTLAGKVSASVKKLWRKPGYKGGNKLGVSFNLTDEQRRQYSERVSGEKNPMYGMSGEKSPVWLGGVSFLPYTPEFNGSLKNKIKRRDDFTCQLCGKKQFKGLGLHHIDYKKENCDPQNLVTLCLSCNVKVNKNREYWKSYFQNLLERRDLLCVQRGPNSAQQVRLKLKRMAF